MSAPLLQDRYRSCLLGLAVGDAVGSPLEGMSADMIFQFFGTADELMAVPGDRLLHYTDDTQMMVGVAQTLLDHGRIVEDSLCRRFAANLQPHRGYGGGTLAVLQAMAGGGQWRHLTESLFPGGSFGNGAAMRVAPIGLYFRDDLDRVWHEARLSALPTHIHPLGIEGAQLLATAVALVSRSDKFNSAAFYDELNRRAKTDEFRWLLSTAAELTPDDSVSILGTGIEAHRSVVTSIACFALAPNDFVAAVGRAIGLGGDTDTIGAMTGALSGAHLGMAALPPSLVEGLENGEMGREAISSLAIELCRSAAGASEETT